MTVNYEENSAKEPNKCNICGGDDRHRSGCPVRANELNKNKSLSCPECGWFDGYHNKTCSKHKDVCALCGNHFLPKTPYNKICEKKHYVKCADCGKLIELKGVNELNSFNVKVADTGGRVTAGNFRNQCNIIEDNEDKFVFELEGKRCKECHKAFMKTPERKKITRNKFDQTYKDNHGGMTKKEYNKSEDNKNRCPECGSVRHKKGCSKYIDPGVCEYCGYKLQSRRHARDCPLYKEPKKCPACGSAYGNHKKSCPHYVKIENNFCPICGGTKSYHKRWCPDYRYLGKCPECGYDLKSNRHAPTCSHYDAEKARKILEKCEQTTLKNYGVRNILLLPEMQKKAAWFASNSLKSPKVSKLNCRIADRLKSDYNAVSQEMCVGEYFYDIYCNNQKTKKNLLIEISPCVSHNSDYDYYYLVSGKSPDVPKTKRAGLHPEHHKEVYNTARSRGYTLLTFMQMFTDDKIVRVINSYLGADDEKLGEVSFGNIINKTAEEFNREHLYSPEMRSKGSYIGVFNDGQLIATMRVRRESSNNLFVEEIIADYSYNIQDIMSEIIAHLKSNYNETVILSNNCLPLDDFFSEEELYGIADPKAFWARTGEAKCFVYDDDINMSNVGNFFGAVFKRKQCEILETLSETMHENGFYKCYDCGYTLFKIKK